MDLTPKEEAKQPTEEELFRGALKDALVVLNKIAPHCQTMDDLRQVMLMGVDDSSQLRFLMSICKSSKR